MLVAICSHFRSSALLSDSPTLSWFTIFMLGWGWFLILCYSSGHVEKFLIYSLLCLSVLTLALLMLCMHLTTIMADMMEELVFYVVL